jgi:hypothetical protein
MKTFIASEIRELQQLARTAVERIVEQDAFGFDAELGECLYLNLETKSRCAIGCLLPEGFIAEEGSTIDTVANDLKNWVTEKGGDELGPEMRLAKNLAKFGTNRHTGGEIVASSPLQQLQSLHDKCASAAKPDVKLFKALSEDLIEHWVTLETPSA